MLQFTQTDIIKEYVALCDHLILLQSFFGIEDDDFPAERSVIEVSRLQYYMPPSLQAYEREKINALLSQSAKPTTADEKLLINLQEVIANPETKSEDQYSFEYITDLHKQMYNEVGDGFGPGELKNSKEIEIFVSAIEETLNDLSIHPVVRVWMVYFVLSHIKPFRHGSKLISRQFCYQFLQQEGYGFTYLLSLEKFIFHQKKMMPIIITENDNPLPTDYLSSIDITHFIEICAQGMMNNLSVIKSIYHKAIRSSFEFESKSPFLRNKMLYWLEEGLSKHQDTLLDSSTEEQDILHHIFKSGGWIEEMEIVNELPLSIQEVSKIIQKLKHKRLIKSVIKEGKSYLTFDYGFSNTEELAKLSYL